MTLSDRIKQLECRIHYLTDRNPYTLTEFTDVRGNIYTSDIINSLKGQIQALKWVESENEKRLQRVKQNTKDYFEEEIRWVETDRFTGKLEPINPPENKNKQQSNKP